MKVLEFETSKGKFKLIDMPDEIRINGWNGYIVLSKYLQISQTKFSSRYYLKNITEEQANNIIGFGLNEKYACEHNKIKLFEIIRSKGIHLFVNPYPSKNDIKQSIAQGYKYKESEEKTFYNPFIFKL